MLSLTIEQLKKNMKKAVLFFALMTSATAFAQCSDLFFSEYIEGSSNNKAIEIYNPTSSTIDLTDYVVYRYNNGAIVPSDSLFPEGNLIAGDVFIAGNSSAVAQILAESDTLHTITFYNGDDALMIKKISTGDTLDIIGVIGVDPGTNWPVGAGATSEFTLVRQIGIQQGQLNWTIGSTEWDVFPQNMLDSLGAHTMTACGACVTTTSSQVVTECDSLVSPSGLYTWTTTGMYEDTIPNAAGCDSIISFDLTIGTNSASLTLSECESYTSPSGLYTWTTSGIYIDTIANMAGCDSIISIDLTIYTPTSSTLSATSCGSYTSPSGLYTWTTSGMYMDTLPNAEGCDSVITVNLTINNIDAGVTQVGETLTADQTTGTYQWIDCSDNSELQGETNQEFTATVSGEYAVVISDNGCVDTSACFIINILGIGENELAQNIVVSPNPTNGDLTIQLGKVYDRMSMNIYSLNGQLVASSVYNQTAEIQTQLTGDAGFYLLVLETEAGDRARLQLVKQ